MFDLLQSLKEIKNSYIFLILNWLPFLLIFIISKFYYPILAYYTIQAPYLVPIIGAENIVGGVRVNEWIQQFNLKNFEALEAEIFNLFLVLFFFLLYSFYSKNISVFSVLLPILFVTLVGFLPVFRNITISILSLALVCSIPIYSKEKGVVATLKMSFEIFYKNIFEFIFITCFSVGIFILFTTYITEFVTFIYGFIGSLASDLNFILTSFTSAFSITLQMVIFKNYAKTY
jgi:hypothetical protein